MSYLDNLRDAMARVREVGDEMDAETAQHRAAGGGPREEDARYHQLNGAMEQALADRRAAVLGRDR